MSSASLQRRGRLLLGAAALIAAPGAPAAADGWSVQASMSQAFEGDTNLTLDPDDDDESLGSTTSLGLTFGSETSRTRFVISPGVTARLFSGSSSTNAGPFAISPRLSSQIDHSIGALDIGGGFNFDVRPTAFSELSDFELGAPDLDVIDQDATQVSFRADAYLGYQIDPRNRFTFGPNVSILRFTDDSSSLSPSTTFGVSGGFSHQLREDLAATFNLGARHVDTDGASSSEDFLIDTDIGVQGQISDRLSLNGGVGLTYRNSKDSGSGADNGIGLTGYVDAAYALRNDLSLSLRGSRGIEPSASGELETRTVLNAGVNHQINGRESIDAYVGYSSQDEAAGFTGDTDDSQFQAGFGYALSLTPEVVARVGYGMRWVPTGRDEAMSHKVSVTFSRSLVLQP